MAAADCWGLVRLVLQNEKGLDMPALAVAHSGNTRAIRQCFVGWRAVEHPHEFDILTMRNARGHHVGIIAKAEDFHTLVLHCDEPQSSIVPLVVLQKLGYKDFRLWRYNGTR